MRQKVIIAFLILSMLISTAGAWAAPVTQKVEGQETPFETTAEAAVLMDSISGKVLVKKNADKQLPPASVTKVMTLLVALEALDQGKIKLSDRVVTSENAWKMGGSQIYLEPGEELSMQEMLIAIAVGSANDACVAVAEHIAGSHQEYVNLMNKKAKALGLKNTHFANDYGLPAEGHYTSANDMAVILREALKYPEFKRLTSIKEYDLRGGEFKLYNTNKLLWWYKGTDGGKTGWTNEAKYCLASTVDREGLRLIAVVLGTAEPRSHFRESMKLYNYGFARYKAVKFAEQGDVIKKLAVGKGVVKDVQVVVAGRAAVTVIKGDEGQVSKEVRLPEMVAAPLKTGERIGELILKQKGSIVATVPLVAKNPVDKASFSLQVYRTFDNLFSMAKTQP